MSDGEKLQRIRDTRYEDTIERRANRPLGQGKVVSGDNREEMNEFMGKLAKDAKGSETGATRQRRIFDKIRSIRDHYRGR